ncbi:MAG: hypothetical protein EOQ47_06310 [Mesorhizobium sp.]|nr:MAG: hypothetical protein EOQ47_06310 [Mesorhizobium sp.]
MAARRVVCRYELFQSALKNPGSSFHGNGELIHLFVLTQVRTENRFALFLELLSKARRVETDSSDAL